MNHEQGIQNVPSSFAIQLANKPGSCASKITLWDLTLLLCSNGLSRQESDIVSQALAIGFTDERQCNNVGENMFSLGYVDSNIKLQSSAFKPTTPPNAYAESKKKKKTKFDVIQNVEVNRNARKRLTTTPSNTPVEVTQLPTPTTRPLHPSNTIRSHLMTDETSIPVFKISKLFRNMNTDKLQSGSMKCKETLEPKDGIPWWTLFVFQISKDVLMKALTFHGKNISKL
ncbi:hypothetical protein Tco_0640420 [Tanacetum coccineum]